MSNITVETLIERTNDVISDNLDLTYVCYYCESRFTGKDIFDSVVVGSCPICPFCPVDSVVWESFPNEISDELLHETYLKQFRTDKDGNLFD